jgi:hypothetical protein
MSITDLAASAFNRGTEAAERGDLPAAQRGLLTSLGAAPYTAMTWLNLGNVLMQEGDPESALGCYRRAMKLEPWHPRGAVNAGIALLTLGQWEEGWELYEQRFALPEFQLRNALKGGDESKMWRGEGNTMWHKSLLVFSEQGVGDTIMCLRYLRRLPLALDMIVARVPITLLRLARASLGATPVAVSVVSDAERIPPHDCLIPFMSLPAFIGQEVDWDSPSRYLKLYDDEQPHPVGRLGGFRVGVCWAGNPNHTGDKVRSIPFDTFAPLLNTRGVSFVNLQVGERAKDADGYDVVRPELNDYYDTAHVMKSLDLVITVDTSVAHLAGALGVPVWTMIPFAPDWRWMRDRDDTPWYQSMTLFRQGTAGDWAGVIERVRSQLVSLVNQRSAA